MMVLGGNPQPDGSLQPSKAWHRLVSVTFHGGAVAITGGLRGPAAAAAASPFTADGHSPSMPALAVRAVPAGCQLPNMLVIALGELGKVGVLVDALSPHGLQQLASGSSLLSLLDQPSATRRDPECCVELSGGASGGCPAAALLDATCHMHPRDYAISISRSAGSLHAALEQLRNAKQKLTIAACEAQGSSGAVCDGAVSSEVTVSMTNSACRLCSQRTVGALKLRLDQYAKPDLLLVLCQSSSGGSGSDSGSRSGGSGSDSGSSSSNAAAAPPTLLMFPCPEGTAAEVLERLGGCFQQLAVDASAALSAAEDAAAKRRSVTVFALETPPLNMNYQQLQIPGERMAAACQRLHARMCTRC